MAVFQIASSPTKFRELRKFPERVSLGFARNTSKHHQLHLV
jgi:hypothetical protein